MEISFELTDEQRGPYFRIRAIRDIPQHRVQAGDLGGWISSVQLPDGTPRIMDNAWLGGNAILTDNAQLIEHALVKGNAVIDGNATIGQGATVRGNAVISGNVRVIGRACVQGNSHIENNVEISGRAHIFGATRISGTTCISGHARIYGNSELQGPTIDGNARIYGEAIVHGNAHISGAADITHQNHFLMIENLEAMDFHPITIYKTEDNTPVFFFQGHEKPIEVLLENVSGKKEMQCQVESVLQLVQCAETLWKR